MATCSALSTLLGPAMRRMSLLVSTTLSVSSANGAGLGSLWIFST